MTYLIWSNQRGMWWRADRRGYTSHLAEAGRYTENEAREIVNDATCDGQLQHEREDAMTGVPYVEFDEVMIIAPDAAEPETVYITMVSD